MSRHINPFVAASLVGVFGAAAGALVAAESEANPLLALPVGFAAGFIVALIASWPGAVAAGREHPATDSIALCGWIGIVLWPLWLVGIIWAHSRPRN